MANPHILAKSPKTFLDRDNWMRDILASVLPHVAVRLAIRLALHLRVKTGRCDPSCATLAAECRISERTTYRLLDLLEHSGWIAVTRVTGRLNQYTLLTPDRVMAGVTPDTTMAGVAADDADVTPDTGMAGDHCQIDDQPLPNRGGTTANKVADKKRGNKEENNGERRKSPEPPKESRTPKATGARKTSANSAPSASGQKKGGGDRRGAADDGGEAFGRFWAAYPKRVAKEAARKAFAKAVENGAAVDTLIAGAQRYAVERQGQDQKYTKHPATWLNGGCWEDEAPGAPVIDEHGNVVAFEREREEQRPSSQKSPLEIYEEWLEENPSLRW